MGKFESDFEAFGFADGVLFDEFEEERDEAVAIGAEEEVFEPAFEASEAESGEFVQGE